MKRDEFKEIPGYPGYAVDRFGNVVSVERKILLYKFVLNGYWNVSLFRGSKTKTLAVHRAVALAWLDSPPADTSVTMVNHKDGNKLNNWYTNLEWATCLDNNLHALKNGLRTDNESCEVRDFNTGQVLEFYSVSEACVFMGIPKRPIVQLRSAFYGKLIAGRYEFRLKSDPDEWFYEGVAEKIRPSRYRIICIHENGDRETFYSQKQTLAGLQLYESQERSMKALAEFAKKLYPKKKIFLEVKLDTAKSPRIRGKRSDARDIIARDMYSGVEISFPSLRACAKHFNVDRSSISSRVDKGIALNNHTLHYKARCDSDVVPNLS